MSYWITVYVGGIVVRRLWLNRGGLMFFGLACSDSSHVKYKLIINCRFIIIIIICVVIVHSATTS